MTMRRLTWINWVELLIGVLLPGITLGPFFLFAVVLGSFTLATSVRAREAMPASMTIMACAGIGLLSLAGLAAVILVGPAAIRRKPVWRFGALLLGAAGLAVGGWAVVASFSFDRATLTGLVLFGAPVVVGTRYVLALMFGRSS